eukprot:5520512-Prymnesium_polylepis.2
MKQPPPHVRAPSSSTASRRCTGSGKIGSDFTSASVLQLSKLTAKGSAQLDQRTSDFKRNLIPNGI